MLGFKEMILNTFNLNPQIFTFQSDSEKYGNKFLFPKLFGSLKERLENVRTMPLLILKIF